MATSAARRVSPPETRPVGPFGPHASGNAKAAPIAPETPSRSRGRLIRQHVITPRQPSRARSPVTSVEVARAGLPGARAGWPCGGQTRRILVHPGRTRDTRDPSRNTRLSENPRLSASGGVSEGAPVELVAILDGFEATSRIRPRKGTWRPSYTISPKARQQTLT